MGERRVGISFSGGAFASLGFSFLATALSACVVPAAWGAAAFLGWWCGRLVFADGTQASFEGRAGRVWALFAALVVLGILPSAATAGMAPEARTLVLRLVMALALVPFEAALKLPICRWVIGHIRLEPGGAPAFTGTYAALLGWEFLLLASFFTVIGWPWAAVAMLRWFCRNIRGDGYRVEFSGTGWGLLWRFAVWTAGIVLLLPIPWVLRSVYAWGAGNLVLVRQIPGGAPA